MNLLNKRIISNLAYLECLKHRTESLRNSIIVTHGISSESIFYNFENNRNYMHLKIKEKHQLKDIAIEFFKFIMEAKPEYSDTELKNVKEFIITLPFEIFFDCVRLFDKMRKSSDEFLYFGTIHCELQNKYKKYEDYMDKVLVFTKGYDYTINRNKIKE